MGLVSKFIGGKRVNYSSGGSYDRRCHAAGLSHTSGPSWHLSPWKSLHGRSPGKILKRRLLARENFRSRRALRFSTVKKLKKRRETASYDKDYGPLATEPDMDTNEFEERCKEITQALKEDALNWQVIERSTLGQHDNPLWHEKRINRLTASRFGAVIKRKATTSCHNLVKSILYPKNLNCKAVIFGRLNEKKAVELYEQKTGNKVDDCGFFCSTDHPFLGASPDGLVGTEGIIEVKCLPSVKGKLEEILRQKNNTCLELDSNIIKLKRKHNYYFQVQGQLNITKRKWCDFVVYTQQEVNIERICVDSSLWTEQMIPILKRFYEDCMLPEIADSRIVRHLRIREPGYILKAQEKKKKQIESKCM